MSTGIDPFDSASLAMLRRLLAAVDPEGPPRLVPLQPQRRARSVCLIPGSFNPPTVAHVALADRAMSDGYESVHFTYAVRTVGKRPSGLMPEDRLLLARAAAPDRVNVSVSSAGLLSEMAVAAAAAFDAPEIAFFIGGDKLEQLFEHRWYADREAALEQLFGIARVLVAPRRDDSERIGELLRAHPRWAPRIEVCHLHPSIAEVSSTRVRQVLRSGTDPTGLVPERVAGFLADVGAFAPPVPLDGLPFDRYAIRAQLFDLVLDGRCTRDVPDLHLLWRVALDPGSQGRELRNVLAESRGSSLSGVPVRP